ncbi:uncharacterized protein CcaverHIS019_0206310 [Cutaneotrichosporon cavernicola]|uniref:RRM domain-containing protein n=1 Tax=Cutaneotrichosporon cavernicola TaxID=279322 RepID=A0AA48KYD1_9TREE|nr:uncharacterized protein CcaverHIS019_0206310 [Cutaneotrichosporon cavernicola]BEI89269.1 hypothetical protein CcaverHIS019_0206310 [Cutaneotrichosporon cavernicola]BEI97045.1 hypothetical protein CcaverHIS631_0206340 [Cutaneotrichosporon cavernicola]BEJ04818.1 hypothetical protein CcaverHIS641_0206350 [Cutaneotrichosporon cavernicola]
MSSGYTIHVSGLAPETSETKLHDFFSFCGKLQSVKKHGTEADITFEKQSAMRTALMLNGGTLDGAHLEVTSSSPAADPGVLPSTASGSTPVGGEFEQEDKPKAAIAAEYLAHGYAIGDHIIQKAIDVDKKQGISTRFLSFLSDVDKKAGERLVGEGQTLSSRIQDQAHSTYVKAREADQQRGVSSTFLSYYTKALATPVGQRVSQFYNEASKTVHDVHEEAMRLAHQKKAASGAVTPVEPAEPVASSADAKAAEAGVAPSTAAPTSAPAPAPPAANPEKAAPLS